jgi:4'-phosphopantetheinyl transferase
MVHVWIVPLDIPDWRDRLAPGRLSHDELQRSERYAFEEDRRRFVICRTILRAILGGYLEWDPHEVTFRQGPHGKPYVDPARSDRLIQFNVTHSADLALVAVSGAREVGVDIERVRPLDGLEDIVARHFAPAEQLALGRVPGSTRLAAFYGYWTLKEAYLKACGLGLGRALAEVDVTRAADHPIRLPDGTGGRRSWRGKALDLAAGYRAALVVEGDAPATTMIAWAADGP